MGKCYAFVLAVSIRVVLGNFQKGFASCSYQPFRTSFWSRSWGSYLRKKKEVSRQWHSGEAPFGNRLRRLLSEPMKQARNTAVNKDKKKLSVIVFVELIFLLKGKYIEQGKYWLEGETDKEIAPGWGLFCTQRNNLLYEELKGSQRALNQLLLGEIHPLCWFFQLGYFGTSTNFATYIFVTCTNTH